MKQKQSTSKKGRQHLNGEEALALARTRHIDSDYMRGRVNSLF
ncbi:LCP family glycopolymer transferase [Bacillus cytotoxicus]